MVKGARVGAPQTAGPTGPSRSVSGGPNQQCFSGAFAGGVPLTAEGLGHCRPVARGLHLQLIRGASFPPHAVLS